MTVLSFVYHKIILNPVVLSLISGFIGAIVGGFATYKLKQDELKLYEKATALSIIEELKVLRDEYQEEFDKQYNGLNEQQYLNVTYTISQDYSTIYTQNAGEIGLIKNTDFRNQIIKANLLIKKYIEDLKIYSKLYEEHYKNNKNFVATAYPKLIDKDCSDIDTDGIIYNNITLKMINKDPSWHDNPNLTEAQITCFYNSYDSAKKCLCNFSNRLKTDYYSLKEVIENVIQKSKELYGE